MCLCNVLFVQVVKKASPKKVAKKSPVKKAKKASPKKSKVGSDVEDVYKCVVLEVDELL